MEIPLSIFPAFAAINELIESNPKYINNVSTASELNGKIEPERKPAMKSPNEPY